VPRLTPEQLAAIKLFEELAASEEHAIHYILEPGDIQLLNNHTCLHHRTAFEDHQVGQPTDRSWPTSAGS
jgi:alpha-ketoglutarate-dependent taurine dioxygenase